MCLAVAQVLLGFDCEHRWIRFAYCRLGHLARVSPSWCDSLRLIDATPLPCGPRETVARSELGGTGGIWVLCRPHPPRLGPRALSARPGHRGLVWRNWAINASDKRSLIAYDH